MSEYDTDKEAYLSRYEALFAPLRDREVRILELGILRGGSLLLWRDWFPRGIVVGLDINPVALEADRIFTYQGRQEDSALLERIARERAPEGFDIIIDDCSHLAADARVSFDTLFRKWLKPRGLYIIEDWGVSYWPEYSDGALRTDGPAGHVAGFAGFIKELVDHIPPRARRPTDAPIAKIELSRGMCVFHKSESFKGPAPTGESVAASSGGPKAPGG